MMLPSAFLIALAGLFGLIIGSFLNVVVYRVPAGISLLRDSQCPNCDAPVRPWQNVPVVSWLALRGKCAGCGSAISARYPLVELATGLAFAGVAWTGLEGAGTFRLAALAQPPVGAVLEIVAFLYLAAISIALTLIDLDTKRLPNAIVLPSYLVMAALLGTAAIIDGDGAAALRSAIGGAALFAFYALLRLIRPDGMGGGDVKLAGVLGIALGWIGWGALIVGAFGAFVLGGLFGVVLLATRRAGRKTGIPFGPWMIAGAWIGVLFGEPLAQAYLQLLVPGARS